MDILTQGGRVVKPVLDIITLLKVLKSREDLLDQLLAFEKDPTGNGDVAKLVKDSNLDAAAIKQFITDNGKAITVLLGTVGDLADQKISWGLNGKEAIGGKVGLAVGADAKLTVAVKNDGDLFGDSVIQFDKTTNAYLTYEIDGAVSADTNVPPIPVGPFSGKLAFGASAEIRAGNYFLHARSDNALDALFHDLSGLALPYSAASLIPDQLIRLHKDGSVYVSAGVSWGKTIVATGEVAADALNLSASPITAEVDLAASASFTAEIDGTFDLLISRESTSTSVRVRLSQADTKKGGTAFTAGIGIDIKGLDALGKSVVAQITTTLNPLIAMLQKDQETYGDLHSLFDTKVSDLATRLSDANLTGAIGKWLDAIAGDLALREKLRTAIVNALDSPEAGTLIDDLQHKIAPVTDLVKKLIQRYQDALGKVNTALQKAAEVKIGIELARKQQYSDTKSVTLDITINPATYEREFHQMVRGDFTAALNLARDGKATLNDVMWGDKGSTTLATSLSISALGKNAALGSLLSQDWNWTLSEAGDLSLGVQTDLDVWSRSWGVLRSVTVAADSRVFAMLSSANQLLDATVSETVTITAAQSWNPTASALGDWEAKMIEIGALSSPTTMTDDLRLNPKIVEKTPYGPIVTSVVLNLGLQQWRNIAQRPPGAAARELATQMARFNVPTFDVPFKSSDVQGSFFLAWDSVREWSRKTAIGGDTQFPDNLSFSSGGTKVDVSKGQLLIVARASRIITSIENMRANMLSWSANSLAGYTLTDVVEAVRNAQKAVMDDVKGVVQPSFSREDLGFAFFTTMWQLAGGPTAAKANVVVLRPGTNGAPDQRFVY